MNLLTSQQRICTDLSNQGWSVLDNCLEPELIRQLAQECRNQHALGSLQDAGIGRAEQRSVQKLVRGDQILWLETGMSAATDMYLTAMDTLRQSLNEQLYLGLESSENHFAVYPPDSFYQKHVDRFRDSDSRTISSVLYLNPEWQPEHGGELRLHLNDQQFDIAPLANRLVLFISADIWHEVLPTKAERLSLTGWFKRRA
ncbi:2OG-Fe(II) oxygenase [Solimicrobium silvestre]|uniref:Putative proline hydroxylase n=1 Tax=Solimicrobium silvestre TaxID=2099400 RepID=A0A2S9GVC3_9BURK|nr:2OG-Fe(II) oxygenase [Solimicrobium silvestre]PRC91663.1 putative proline hydroxylase [Solimicrobium silvestre]